MTKVLGRIGDVIYTVNADGLVQRDDGTVLGPVQEVLKFLGGYMEDVPEGKAPAAPAAQTAAPRLRRPDLPSVPGGDSDYLRSKGLWNDPGSGRFAPRGFSTLKSLLMDMVAGDKVRDAARGRGKVMARVADNRLARAGINKGDFIEVHYKDDEYGRVQVTGKNGKKRWYDVQWARFDETASDDQTPEPEPEVEVPELEPAPAPTEVGADPAKARAAALEILADVPDDPFALDDRQSFTTGGVVDADYEMRFAAGTAWTEKLPVTKVVPDAPPEMQDMTVKDLSDAIDSVANDQKFREMFNLRTTRAETISRSLLVEVAKRLSRGIAKKNGLSPVESVKLDRDIENALRRASLRPGDKLMPSAFGLVLQDAAGTMRGEGGRNFTLQAPGLGLGLDDGIEPLLPEGTVVPDSQDIKVSDVLWALTHAASNPELIKKIGTMKESDPMFVNDTPMNELRAAFANKLRLLGGLTDDQATAIAYVDSGSLFGLMGQVVREARQRYGAHGNPDVELDDQDNTRLDTIISAGRVLLDSLNAAVEADRAGRSTGPEKVPVADALTALSAARERYDELHTKMLGYQQDILDAMQPVSSKVVADGALKVVPPSEWDDRLGADAPAMTTNRQSGRTFVAVDESGAYFNVFPSFSTSTVKPNGWYAVPIDRADARWNAARAVNRDTKGVKRDWTTTAAEVEGAADELAKAQVTVIQASAAEKFPDKESAQDQIEMFTKVHAKGIADGVMERVAASAPPEFPLDALRTYLDEHLPLVNMIPTSDARQVRFGLTIDEDDLGLKGEAQSFILKVSGVGNEDGSFSYTVLYKDSTPIGKMSQLGDRAQMEIDPADGMRTVQAALSLRSFLQAELSGSRNDAGKDLDARYKWAETALDAGVEPTVLTGGKGQHADKLRAMARVIPRALVEAMGPVNIKGKGRGRSNYRSWETLLTMAKHAGLSVYLHEYGHHIERHPELSRMLWAFYVRRTGGVNTPTKQMGAGFGRDEVSRADEFYSRYAGKDYGSAAKRSMNPDNGRELFTMGLEGVFHDKEGERGEDKKPKKIDDEYAAFILGSLVLASRAKAPKKAEIAPDRFGSADAPLASLATSGKPLRGEYGDLTVGSLAEWVQEIVNDPEWQQAALARYTKFGNDMVSRTSFGNEAATKYLMASLRESIAITLGTNKSVGFDKYRDDIDAANAAVKTDFPTDTNSPLFQELSKVVTEVLGSMGIV